MTKTEELEMEILKLETLKVILEVEAFKTQARILNEVYENGLKFKNEILNHKNEFKII